MCNPKLTLTKNELTGHDVFELMQGRLIKSHWLDSSIFITEECLGETGLVEVLIHSLGDFNYYGPTEVSSSDWQIIRQIVYSSKSALTQQLVSEIDNWTKDCFENSTCFTICGP
ncbi:hypothetical protein J2Z70_000426 [Paenibacillus silagei]|uniref:Uncharacterized protein n=1 Tax=Paenibacillus silagei TaxID=1670801 RepID=A0ABS4NJS1_9BACL|nr:hypothetical protein [Paenibacillus silagei]